jgi:predicted nuclease of predicted toxin-antitoxin system
MRFFADHCVSNYVIEVLQRSGHEVFRLRDYIPPDSPDSEVIAKAHELDCILVSLNGDFADILNYPPENYKGIIALQVRDHPEVVPQIMVRLMDYMLTYAEMEHYRGKLLLVEAHRIRVRE